MLKDVSHWIHIGYGSKSTLKKEELKNEENSIFLIKYPRNFKKGTSWEDITELIAAEIGSIMGLEMMKVEIVMRNGKRGCLLRNYVDELKPMMNEVGASLLASADIGYKEIQEEEIPIEKRVSVGFGVIEKLNYWADIKQEFINMLVFDMLIGNQDRHTSNWEILFFENHVKLAPIYDNGASLGFRLEDITLEDYLKNEYKLKRYARKYKPLAGVFEEKKINVKDLVMYLKAQYPKELGTSLMKLKNFDLTRYESYIHSLTLLTETQREWLLCIIPYRRRYFIDLIEEEE